MLIVRTLRPRPLRLRSTNKYLRVKQPRKSSDPAAAAAHLLTRDEARRIATNIAKLPERVAGKSKFSAVNNKT